MILKLEGLNCSNCAEKIKDLSSKIDGVKSNSFNFVTNKLNIELENSTYYDSVKDEVVSIVNKLEPDVEVKEVDSAKMTVKRGKTAVVASKNEEFVNSSKEINLELNGLNCTNCAEKIKSMSAKLEGVESSDLNFITKKLKLVLKDETRYDGVKSEIIAIVNKLEPDVEVIALDDAKTSLNKIDLELNGLTCTDCAGKIEKMTSEFKGVTDAKFNFVTKKFTVGLENPNLSDEVYENIVQLVNKLEPDVEIIDLRDNKATNILKLELENLNCSDCAGKIENFVKALKGVEGAKINLMNKVLEVEYRRGTSLGELKDGIKDIILTLEPDIKINDIRKSKNREKTAKKSMWQSVDKNQLTKILVSTILLFLPRFISFSQPVSFGIYLVAYLLIGFKIIKQAFINTRAGIPFDENFLMTIATVGAFAIGEYPEAIMVMLLYQIGETMQGIAVNHSRDSITSLMDIRPDYANLLVNDEEMEVDPNEVAIGDIILVKPGERVPLDGVVIEGKSSLDTSSITGESVPRGISVGDEIVSGVVNIQGLLKVKVNRVFGESTISKILDLVENASSKKAETENFITKFSRYYTPVVVIVAALLAIVPPIIGMGSFANWFYRATVFLVISCPCALVISVPLGFFGGLGGASKEGILIKGSNYLEGLADLNTIVFDKTGTLTEGVFEVTEIKSYTELSQEEVLKIAAYGERYSNHPIGKSVIQKFDREIDEGKISDYEEIAGQGIRVKIEDKIYLLGNKKLLDNNKIKVNDIDTIGTIIYIGKDNKHIGTIIVSDRIKESASEDLKKLKEVGIEQLVMLSGDNQKTVDKVSNILGLDKAYGGLLPQDKVEIFEKIITGATGKNKVAFVGDGVNDAPVLARADVGIAMGGLGSDAAIEASDVVIMTDDIGKLSKGIKIGRKTRRIVMENIVLALGIKLIVLSLGAFGQANMIQAVFADVGVSIIAILNSIRALNTKNL